MRVLFVSHSFPLPGEPLSNVGGMQRLAVEQRSALAAHSGVELTSLVLESSSLFAEARTVPFLGRLFWQIPKLVRENRIDVVLFSSMVTAALAPALRRRLGESRVVLAATPVGRDVTLPNVVYQRFVPHTLAALDLVLPISAATATECLVRGVEEGKMTIVPCGVSIDRFPPVDRVAARAQLLRVLEASGVGPVPEGSLLLCSVGRHQERKGFHWFIEQVMPRLPGDVVYLLGGAGPMTQRIREAAARVGPDKNVRVLGRLSEEMLLTLFGGSDLFVMPNIPVRGDIEGFGVVMLEAGLCGLPIVAADLEGIRDVVSEGENGVLVTPGDAEAFAATIEGFRSDRGRLERASALAVTSTAARFSWTLVVEQYVEALRQAVGRGAGPPY
jgi:phosphatidylinositol alpha-1,6-mannosyltransferase